MNKQGLIIIFLFTLRIFGLDASAADTLHIQEYNKFIGLDHYVVSYEDSAGDLNIDKLIDRKESVNDKFITKDRLNFGFTTHTVWLQLVIQNDTDEPVDYVLEIANPDLDYVNFFHVNQDSLISFVHTGELADVSSRAIHNRNFLFPVSLQPGEVDQYFVSINNSGNSCTIPLTLKSAQYFERTDNRSEILNWLIYGLLGFIVIFNAYMYFAIKDKVNLYYALSLLFATIFLLHYEGYFFSLNPGVYIERIKWISPCLYSVFLLLFTRSFLSSQIKFEGVDRLINPLIIFVLIAPFMYMIKYPVSLIANLGVPILVLLTFVLIIILAVLSYRKDYLPSKFFLSAYLAVFAGLLIHQLRELNFFNVNLFTFNAIKIGLTLQNILLTFAVLERFRIRQEDASKTIRESLGKIEFQNRELEIINTELEKLSIVASETDNSIAIYDKDGTIEWGNTGFEQLYEVKLNELIRTKKDRIEDIVPNSKIRMYVNKCLTSKLPIMFETEVQLEDKKTVWIQTTLSPYIRANELRKIIAIDTDITNLKVYEKELETAKEKAVESDKLKTAFLGNLSHEIRTPLNGILGFSELLNRTELDDEERKIYLDIIKSSGEQLMHIIDDIVDISLIESNQLKIYLADFDLRALLQDVMEFFRSYKTTINKAHIELESDIRLDENTSHIISDSFRLRQILTNLIRNAFKFTHEGYVRISSYTQHKFLYFCVEDSGIGITQEKKDVIFERFRQGEETLSRKYGGTGLGLSISKGILEKMGGKIWIDTSYHSGFRIYFSIPLILSKNRTDEKKELHADVEDISDRIQNKNILVVEDHDVSYKYLEEILLPYKVKLSWATNGVEAVSLVRRKEFDLILMDINLPEMDGVAATREIRKISEHVPIFVQTAHAMESEIKKIMASGCNDMIGKPFSEKEFFEKLAKVL